MKRQKIYMVGIGGVGMSALAQYVKSRGAIVTGSDREASPVTELLEKKGIAVTVGQEGENVPSDAGMVVYSDAVPEDNPERVRAYELGIPQLSYFKMLGQVSLGKRMVAVAGTKGKTTTTGMLARILRDAGVSPTAVIGSIVKDFDSNYLHGDSDIFVVEACEYRDHVLELSPQILVLTNVEWDHTDWFPSIQALQETFRRAIERVPANGAVITNPSNPNIAPLLSAAKCRVVDYTREPAYKLRIATDFNRENARAAAAAARAVLPTISDATIASALADFHDAWRRFEYKGKTAKGADVYDDYAHNPMSVRAATKALREKTKGKVFVAFHPHLYSRTRDLLDEFAVAFSDADKVFVAPIYAAREADDGTISSEILAERIRATGTDAIALEFDAIEKNLADVDASSTIITMGAGDIYKVADALVGKNKRPP
jgi:UDP-N-acetylmuramate--alanine ligase